MKRYQVTINLEIITLGPFKRTPGEELLLAVVKAAESYGPHAAISEPTLEAKEVKP